MITAIKNFRKWLSKNIILYKTKGGNMTAFSYEHSLDNSLEFFSKAGSMFSKRKSFYSNEMSITDLFEKAWDDGHILGMQLLLWLRDCRGGAGNRSGFAKCLVYLANNYPEWVVVNIHKIPLYGRWSDLVPLFKTELRGVAGGFWADAIRQGDVLAAKWAKRHYKPIREDLGLKESEFRKLLSAIRQDHIVEHKMCQKLWDKIDYNKVPSVAMSRYTNAFKKNDPDRFEAYKKDLESGKATIHADVLFPHDCVRTALMGDAKIADAQFNALPNFMADTGENVMCICDSSGSMCNEIGGSVQSIHVSMGLSLYCSSRVPQNSPFYKRFIKFCSEGSFVDWRKYERMSEALKDRQIFDGAVGSTRIDLALDLILKIAKERNISQELMPSTLLIISDMQFSEGAASDSMWDSRGLDVKESCTEIDKCIAKWKEAGYKAPKIVYWNTAGYQGQQDVLNSKNVGLVSGFSPSILKAIITGEDFTPMSVMMKALEKYEVNNPEDSVWV